MAEINSEDYHDYVFQNGELLGEFDQMYQKAMAIPWHQDEAANEFDVQVVKLFLSLRSPYPTILDVGCGLGYFANELTRFGGEVYGVDISPTAIAGLKQRFPNIAARTVPQSDSSSTFSPQGATGLCM